MAHALAKTLGVGVMVACLAHLPAAAAPVNSDLAVAENGGGCYPTGIHPAVLDMLTLINPEWAPILNGQTVDSAPVLVHGTVQGMHGDTSGDFPATHIRADVNHFVALDPADADRLATGNDDLLLHFEWEAGAYPAWAWAGTGDRVVGLGRWIFDCGHPGPRRAPAPARARPDASSMATAPAPRPAPASTSSTARSCILRMRRPPSAAGGARS